MPNYKYYILYDLYEKVKKSNIVLYKYGNNIFNTLNKFINDSSNRLSNMRLCNTSHRINKF